MLSTAVSHATHAIFVSALIALSVIAMFYQDI